MYSRIANQMYKISYTKELPSTIVYLNEHDYWVYSNYEGAIWLYQKGAKYNPSTIVLDLYKNVFIMRGNPYA